MIVVSLVLFLTAITLPFLGDLEQDSNFDQSVKKVVIAMRRARSLAQGVSHNTDWGVYIESSQVTIFSGSSYSSRVENRDEVIGFSKELNINGEQEVVFEKNKGFVGGSSTSILNLDDQTQNISVNNKGVIEW